MKALYALIVFVVLAGWYSFARADAVAVANIEGVKITLFNEKCELKEVSNLPYKATWVEDGRTYKGCWAANQGFVVGFFVDDKSVAVMPMRIFQKVTGA
jgi:hypothetical protein